MDLCGAVVITGKRRQHAEKITLIEYSSFENSTGSLENLQTILMGVEGWAPIMTAAGSVPPV